jgi:hypothetical protein
VSPNVNSADHFSHEDWVDFVRGVATPEQRRDIEHHLDTGCRDCAVQRHTWHSVAEMARADQAFAPPASAVRHALAFYSVQKPVGPVARAFEAVKVLFDSALMPMTVGVRSTTVPRRKVLYSVGDLLVDVQIETRHNTRTTLVGQVTAPKGLEEHAEGVPVVILRHLKVVAEATTNRLGEFQVEVEGSRDDLSVALRLKEQGRVLSLGLLRGAQQ